MTSRPAPFIACLALFVVISPLLVTLGCGSSGLGNSGAAPNFPSEVETTPAEDSIGERLFLDTRFAEYFATNMKGVNTPLATGDPAVEQVPMAGGVMSGPFAGKSINCRSCHFVTEFQGVSGAGNRTYADFTARSPIPKSMGGFDHTPRNAMQMVGSLQPRSGPTVLHFDGEFATAEDLVEGTMTGRNFGWLPTQHDQAVAHIAAIIRGDDGSDDLAKDRTAGYSYAKLFLSADSGIPSDLRIPASDRIDVAKASDQQVLDLVAKCISTYMADLLFSQDEFGRYIGSPYDAFLRLNHLPVQPNAGESPEQYAQRLLGILQTLSHPIYVDASMGSFQYHDQPWVFGPTELAGLKIFLKSALGATDGSQHAGNCAACHVPPNFSDFSFHNTGVSQEEYDAANGNGTFAALIIPSLSQRMANYDAHLPQSASHPNASERFRRAAEVGHPEFADLGLWNTYQNPDDPHPQATLSSIVCATGNDCSVDKGLANTIAEFKTPTLRDLEDSGPYFHNGSKAKLGDVVEFYIRMSQLARQDQMRNAPREFQGMSLSETDIDALVAFLRSLTEDYDDA